MQLDPLKLTSKRDYYTLHLLPIAAAPFFDKKCFIKQQIKQNFQHNLLVKTR